MVTLLVAFFVMLFALSNMEKAKFDAFLSGLDQFGNPAAADILDPVGEPITPPVPAPSPAPASPPAPAKAATSRLDPCLGQLGQRLLEAVAAAGYPGTVEIEHDERGLGVAIGTDDVLFDVGASRVTDQGLRILDALAPPARRHRQQHPGRGPRRHDAAPPGRLHELERLHRPGRGRGQCPRQPARHRAAPPDRLRVR